MKTKRYSRRRRTRWHAITARFSLVLIGLALGARAPAAETPPYPPEPPHRLILERIEIEGNHRTPDRRIRQATGLSEGDLLEPRDLLIAAGRLESSILVRRAAVHTRAGSAPGRVIAVFEVEEPRPHFLLGVGYEDLSGWYLIPLQLNLDNLTGNGERSNLSLRYGLRTAGLVLSHRRESGDDPRRHWQVRTRIESQDRLYFSEDVEIRHRLSRAGFDLAGGIPLWGPFALRGWISGDALEADSTAVVHSESPDGVRSPGDEIAFGDLPPAIQGDLAGRFQTALGAGLDLDSRRHRGLARAGFWGRTGIEAVLSKKGDFARYEAELRRYQPLGPGLQLAARSRLGVVGAQAPFYERYYVGGLYTIRGYPSQSLSPPGGDLRQASLSLELRGSWIGPAENPRLVGLLFVDAAIGWDSGLPALEDGAAALGYGFRLRLPLLGRIGLDVGHPLDPTPVGEAFHINLSLGWTF